MRWNENARRWTLVLGACLVGGLWVRPAAGTLYVPMADADLAARSAAVAVVEVLAIEPALDRGLPASDYVVRVERAIQGDLEASVIVVRVPGGEDGRGRGFTVFGAPRFAVGERVLLFLGARHDGSRPISQLMLGAFHLARQGTHELALRDLGGAQAMQRSAGGLVPVDEADTARDAAAFVSWLEDRAAGIERAADYFVASTGPAATAHAQEKHSLATGAFGLPWRWFVFDERQPVRWRALASGQPGISGGGFAELEQALAAWNDDSTSEIDYRYDGTSTSTDTGCGATSGTGLVVFEDPNAQIAGAFGGTGVLAVGGSCYDSESLTFGGRAYSPARNSVVILQDGLADLFAREGSAALAEILAHELGHTLGFGHSADRDALMYASRHVPAVGARLGWDDRTAAATVYGDGPLPPPLGPPPAPKGLTAKALDARSVRLAWGAPTADVELVLVYRKAKGPLALVATLPASATDYLDQLAKAGGTYSYTISFANGSGEGAKAKLRRVRLPKK